ncbi:MAG: hypothetical protein HY689_03075 [Chloroflexi bacterium]|nr:hypothetical protein [Chloroflexota bacterium]
MSEQELSKAKRLASGNGFPVLESRWMDGEGFILTVKDVELCEKLSFVALADLEAYIQAAIDAETPHAVSFAGIAA